MAYAYRGNNFAIEAPSEYTIDPKLCGTYCGYRKHKRNHQTVCPECREAKRIRSAEDRAKVVAARIKTPPVFDASKCGTPAGYQRHIKFGGGTCAQCKVARAKYMAEYRK